MIGIFLIIGSLIFAGQVVGAFRTGTTRIPVKILEFEEFDRNESAANFWGITAFNAVIAAILFAYGAVSLMENYG